MEISFASNLLNHVFLFQSLLVLTVSREMFIDLNAKPVSHSCGMLTVKQKIYATQKFKENY